MELDALFASWDHVDVHENVLILDWVELTGALEVIFCLDYHLIYLWLLELEFTPAAFLYLFFIFNFFTFFKFFILFLLVIGWVFFFFDAHKHRVLAVSNVAEQWQRWFVLNGDFLHIIEQHGEVWGREFY